MIRYMTLASVAKVDDMYAGALDEANRIKADSSHLKIKNHRRDQSERAEELGFGVFFYIGRFWYKFVRILYASFHFYFFPYMALIITYIANWMRG